MEKVWTYVMLSVGLALIMNLAGIPTGLDWLLSSVGLSTSGSTVNLSTFFIAIVALFTLATGGAFIIGFFGRSAPEYSFLAPFASVSVLIFVTTFISVVNYMQSQQSYFFYPILVIFGVLSVGFIFAIVEWVFGR